MMFSSPSLFFSSDQEIAYYDLVLSLSPTAYWRFGEPSGTTANDEISTNDGTYVASPTLGSTGLISSDADTCIRLNGTTQLVTMGNILNPGTSDMSVVIWYNADTLATLNGQRLIQKRGTGAFGTAAGWMIKISTPSTNGWMETSVDAGDGSYAIMSTSTTAGINTGATHMVVITWDNSAEELKLYVDGVFRETATVTGSLSGKSISTTQVLTVGCADTGGSRTQFFDGFVDEGAIWIGTALTSTQISNLYAAGTA